MEIKVLFSAIIGILMMVTVIVAAVAFMNGLTQVTVEECTPADYLAKVDMPGESCGLDSSGSQVKCGSAGSVDGIPILDRCIDSTKNMCCPTSNNINPSSKKIVVQSGKCCSITNLNYKP
jgi:hypothetical protein